MSLFAKNLRPYDYQPIPWPSKNFRCIRILPTQRHVLPGFADTPRIQIVEVNGFGATPYDALSYAWNIPKGQVLPDRMVIVETATGPRQLRVFRQLELALIKLQDVSEHLLFVDQICINQNDAAEKEHQVKLMGEIYSRCNRAIIWLGPGTRSSDLFFSYVSRLASEGILSRVMGPRVGQFMNVWDAVMDPTLEVTESEKEDRDDFLELISAYGPQFPLGGMADVMERAWYKRVWTVQEACLPPDILLICGQKQLCFDCFRSGMLFFNIYNTHWVHNSKGPIAQWKLRQRDHLLDLNTSLLRVFQERKAIHKLGSRQNLYDIVLKYNVNDDKKKIGVTLAVDRIFGLLGLTAEDDPLTAKIKVDYKIGVAKVYTDTAAVLMEHNVDLLLYSQFPKRLNGEDSLPSWVPDWSMSLKIPCGYAARSSPAFSAGGQMSAQKIEYSASSEALTLRGILHDTICQIGEEMLLTDPEKQIQDQVDYRSAARFFSEISQMIDPASQEADSTALAPGEEAEIKLLRLSDAGLTLKEFTDEMGPVEGLQRLRNCHAQIKVIGDALIRGDDYISSSFTTRFMGNLRKSSVYTAPYSFQEAINNAVRNPISAANICLFGIAHLVMGIARATLDTIVAPLLPLYHRLRRKLGAITLRLPQEQRNLIYERVGVDPNSIVDHLTTTFCNNLLKNTQRRVYVTERGYAGLGPKHMQAGDKVVVFIGGTVPHIIRAQQHMPVADTGRWSYVGEAYCDGIMNGEILQQDGAGEASFALI
ncbi:Heterokaryon incompatibility protein [Paramyrothecium foliicola]|nr:Heterokaryon incompatibility protein [Paramyrothecium foliicola]